jgi:hypothetical protein
MGLFLEIVAIGWGLRMIFRKDPEGWGIGNWIGVMMVAGVILLQILFYMMTRTNMTYGG